MAQSSDPTEHRRHVNGSANGETAWSGYASEEERPPLASYATLAGGFSCGLAAFFVLRRQRGKGLPEQLALQDIGLVAGASFALSRLVTKKKVTAFLRAPFTEYQGKGDAPGELEERPRGEGAKRAIGELLICPYCLGLWVVAGFSVGLIFAPRVTRFVASLFSALTISDFFQIAYKAAEEKGL